VAAKAEYEKTRWKISKVTLNLMGCGVSLTTHLYKRWGEPEDVAYLAVFLASDESSYIHGDLIRVDGGERLSRYSV
jgi:NAD(P)-dependent dehydrogenase (short-subunit alcohol dehydrogenase family)